MIHKITGFYKNIYLIGKQISKRDRIGLWQKIEHNCLEILSLTIEAAYLTKIEKPEKLKMARIKIETIKQLVRLTENLQIIKDTTYIKLEREMIEISKMNTNWLNWIIKPKEDSR